MSEQPEVTLQKQVESKEGPRPEQFIRTIEEVAKAKADYSAKLEHVLETRGRIKTEGYNLVQELGPFNEGLVAAADEVFIVSLRQLEELPVEDTIKETLLPEINRFIDITRSKRQFVDGFEQNTPSSPDQDNLERNRLIAGKMFAVLFPDIEKPEDLHYTEIEQGVLFTTKNREALVKIFDTIKSMRIANSADQVTEVSGFFVPTKYGLPSELGTIEDHDLGVCFLLSKGEIDNQVIVNRRNAKHENEHLFDFMVASDLDKERTTHNRSRKKETDWILQTDTAFCLKSEVLAYESTDWDPYDPEAESPYIILTEKYNYEDILSLPEEEIKSARDKALSVQLRKMQAGGAPEKELQSATEKFMLLVRESQGAVGKLWAFYGKQFGYGEYTRNMAAAVLYPFPLEDWPTIVKAVARYSAYKQDESKEEPERGVLAKLTQALAQRFGTNKKRFS